jgi:hypothetical protein
MPVLLGGEVVVAIGWGKSFEEQVEEASQRASQERAPRVAVEERVRRQRQESLKLSRSRVEQQLERAVHPAHREMLMKALQALEKEAEEVDALPEVRNP